MGDTPQKERRIRELLEAGENHEGFGVSGVSLSNLIGSLWVRELQRAVMAWSP